MAGQYGDITSFLPKDGVNYNDVIDEVINANAIKEITGLGTEARFNNAVTTLQANVENMFLRGEIEKSKAKMQASNIIGQGKMNAAPKQPKQSPFDQALEIGSQIAGIAGGLGAFSGGGSSFGNDGFGSFGDYRGIPSNGWGIF